MEKSHSHHHKSKSKHHHHSTNKHYEEEEENEENLEGDIKEEEEDHHHHHKSKHHKHHHHKSKSKHHSSHHNTEQSQHSHKSHKSNHHNTNKENIPKIEEEKKTIEDQIGLPTAKQTKSWKDYKQKLKQNEPTLVSNIKKQSSGFKKPYLYLLSEDSSKKDKKLSLLKIQNDSESDDDINSEISKEFVVLEEKPKRDPYEPKLIKIISDRQANKLQNKEYKKFHYKPTNDFSDDFPYGEVGNYYKDSYKDKMINHLQKNNTLNLNRINDTFNSKVMKDNDYLSKSNQIFPSLPNSIYYNTKNFSYPSYNTINSKINLNEDYVSSRSIKNSQSNLIHPLYSHSTYNPQNYIEEKNNRVMTISNNNYYKDSFSSLYKGDLNTNASMNLSNINTNYNYGGNSLKLPIIRSNYSYT